MYTKPLDPHIEKDVSLLSIGDRMWLYDGLFGLGVGLRS